jgi:6-pyruvoyltetrahydropterin/6-carboxytetrahydropterin synthase
MTLDAGHRVPGHQGQCRNLHGHTYTVEVTVEGQVADDGMIVDFGILKTVMMDEVHARWDHAFIGWEYDGEARAALATNPDWKAWWMARPPTAENLA